MPNSKNNKVKREIINWKLPAILKGKNTQEMLNKPKESVKGE
jgi:hypothetical protein